MIKASLNRIPRRPAALLVVVCSVILALHTTCAMAQKNPIATKNYNAGVMHARSQNYSEAAEKFQQACKDDPDWAEAHCMWGYMMLKQGKTQEAQAELEKSYAMKPDAPETLVYLGILKQMTGQIESAQKLLEKYLSLYPQGDDAPRVKAMLGNVTADIQQRQRVSNSKGQDNYLAEAAARGFKRWDSSQMPIKIFIRSGQGVKGYSDKFQGILKQSFNQWVEASAGKIQISFVNKPDEADIVCSWHGDPAEVSSPVEGGQADVLAEKTGKIKSAQIGLLTSNSSFGQGHDDASMTWVCLHEIGHALGILGHSSDPYDVMFGFLTANPRDNLSDRDKKTILKVYSTPF